MFRLYAALLLSITLFVQNNCTHPPLNKNHKASLQAKTSHEIRFISKDGDGVCTGTSIGPHAILTAEHCNKEEKTAEVMLDYSTKVYDIVDSATDGHDHVIYLLNGVTFKDIQPYKVKEPTINEKVYIYGYGGRVYPGTYKSGRIVDEYDPSEIDRFQKINYYSIEVIQGDSGSAIYAEDGSIVGVITYYVGGINTFGQDYTESAGFQLDFPKETIEFAQKY